jgi:hypothetical protein
VLFSQISMMVTKAAAEAVWCGARTGGWRHLLTSKPWSLIEAMAAVLCGYAGPDDGFDR